MSVPYQQIKLYLNVETGKWVNENNAVVSDRAWPNLRYRSKYILCITCYNADDSAASFNLTDSFEFFLDGDFIHTDNLMLSSDNTKFNVSGDWDDLDVANGKISCRVFCNTGEDFTGSSGINDQQRANVWGEIKRYVSGEEMVILQDQCIAWNVVEAGEGIPDESDPLYRTASAQDSIDATLLKKDFTGEYSAKSTIVDADMGILNDSADSNTPKYFTFSNLWTWILSKIFTYTQVTITDDADTDITLGAIATYRAFKVEYCLESGNNIEQGEISIRHANSIAYPASPNDGRIYFYGASDAFAPPLIKMYGVIDSGNLLLRVTAASVGASPKMNYRIINKTPVAS